MLVRLNGDPHECGSGWTVADLVANLGLRDKRVAVEVNRNIIPQDRYDCHRLRAGDEIEIIHFVGGG